MYDLCRFIWVKRQIEKICYEITESGVERALTELPKDLDEMYLEMLHRVRTNKSSRAATIAENALKLVLYAVRPLSPEELIEAISFTATVSASASASSRDNLTLPAVFDICQNLVVLDKRLGVVRFAHFSVQEFLSTQFNSAEVHTCVAEICLTILLTPGANGGHKSENLAMTHYSILNWPEHVRRSGTGSNALAGLWKIFLMPSSSLPYKQWVSRISGSVWELRSVKSTLIAPLLVACFYQLVDVFGWLLHREANPNCTNDDGSTSLHLAASNGNHHIV